MKIKISLCIILSILFNMINMNIVYTESKSYSCNLDQELDLKAKEYAKNDILNQENENTYSEGLNENENICFQNKYREYYNSYLTELENFEKELSQEAYKNGVYDMRENDELYIDYKEYPIYETLKAIYQESYEKGKKDISRYLAILFVGSILLVMLVFRGIKWIIYIENM